MVKAYLGRAHIAHITSHIIDSRKGNRSQEPNTGKGEINFPPYLEGTSPKPGHFDQPLSPIPFPC